MKKSILLAVIATLCSCSVEHKRENFDEETHEKKHVIGPKQRIKRYEITVKDPPVIMDGINVMKGSSTQWPNIDLIGYDGTTYLDDNARAYMARDYETKERRLGKGPSFIFNKVKRSAVCPMSKSSFKITYKKDQVMVDSDYCSQGNFAKEQEIVHLTYGFKCLISVEKGLECEVECFSGDCSKVIAYHDAKDPIIEVTRNSYPGMYAITQKGKLLHIFRERSKMQKAVRLHDEVKFLPNSDGRYFINGNADEICMQDDKYNIYCRDITGVDNASAPSLQKIEQAHFLTEEISFSGRHHCLISAKREVWCAGDNSCGQITGKHNEEQLHKELKKVDFLLGPAKQIFAYPGGTCTLLKDGQLQCFGLGASVLRERILPDDKYDPSFSWFDGFRPYMICAGGAERGL